ENVYDAQGNRIRRTTGGESGPGHIVEFTYDLLDQVVGVDIDGRGAARLEHDAAGRLIREELAEDLDRRFAYDAEGRMAAQEVSRGGATLFVTRYEYDAVGNLT